MEPSALLARPPPDQAARAWSRCLTRLVTSPPYRCMGAPCMPQLTELTTYDDVMRSFSWDRLWELFDGDRDHMNLAHECLDRHRDQGTAISVKFADGHREHYDYATLSDLSSRFANWLTTLGIGHGDRRALVHALRLGGAGAPHQRLPTALAPDGAACRGPQRAVPLAHDRDRQ